MNAHALLEDLRTRGVTLEANGLTLRVAAPEDVATEELHETVSRHKHALIRLLERERQRLEEAERLGLLIKWSKEPGYVAIHDPTTGDWHEVLRLRVCTLGNRGRQSAQPVWQRMMSWYSVTARPLYIELRALGITVQVEENPDLGPLDYGLVIDGLSALPDGRSRRLRKRIMDNEEALVRIVLDRRDPDLHAVRSEASCG